MGALPRDLFQSTMRVRHLRENKMVFFLSTLGGGRRPLGMAAITERYAALRTLAGHDLRALAIEQKAARDASKGAIKVGGAAGDVEVENEALVSVEGAHLEPWFIQLLKRNHNEVAVSQTLPEEVYAHFLAECGYRVLRINVGVELALKKVDVLLPYWELATVREGTEEFDDLDALLRSDEGELTQKQRQEWAKTHFRACLEAVPFDMPKDVGETLEALNTEFPEDSTALLQAAKSRGIGVPMVWLRARKQATRPVWPPWATRAGYEALWSDKRVGYGHGNVGVFRNVALEKMGVRAVVEAARRDARKVSKFVPLTCALPTSKLLVVRRVCAALDIAHSCEAKEWGEAEWRALLPAFDAPWKEVDGGGGGGGSGAATTLRDHARHVFDVRHQLVGDAEREREITPERLLMLDVSAVLSRWSGTTVERERVGEGKVRASLEGGGGGPLLDDYSAFRAATLPQLKEQFPGNYDAARKELGRLWELEKGKRGVSPPKSKVFYTYATQPALDGLLWAAVKAASTPVEE